MVVVETIKSQKVKNNSCRSKIVSLTSDNSQGCRPPYPSTVFWKRKTFESLFHCRSMAARFWRRYTSTAVGAFLLSAWHWKSKYFSTLMWGGGGGSLHLRVMLHHSHIVFFLCYCVLCIIYVFIYYYLMYATNILLMYSNAYSSIACTQDSGSMPRCDVQAAGSVDAAWAAAGPERGVLCEAGAQRRRGSSQSGGGRGGSGNRGVEWQTA